MLAGCWLGAGWVAVQEWRGVVVADQATRCVDAFGAAAEFTERLSLERGAANQLLVADAVAGGAPLGAAAKARAGTDAVFERTILRVERLPRNVAEPLAQHLRDTAAGLGEARALAARNVTKPRSQREANVALTYLEAVARTVLCTGEVVAELEKNLARLEPGIAQVASIGRLSLVLRDFAGRRSLFYSQYVGGGVPITGATLARVLVLTGRVDLVWEQLQRAVDRAGSPPALEAALGVTRAVFFDEGSKAYAAVLDAGQRGTGPPMTIDEWRPWTTKVLQTTLAPRDAALEEALARATALGARARANLTLAVGWELFVTVLIVVLAIIVGRRVVQPIAALTAVIGKVTAGDLNVEVPAKARRDEIGAIAKATEAFKISSAKRLAAEAETTRASGVEALRAAREESAGGFEASTALAMESMVAAGGSMRKEAQQTVELSRSMSEQASLAAHDLGEAAGSIARVALSADELHGAVSEVSANAQRSAAVARRAAEQAQAAEEGIGRLVETSTRIGDVVRLIADIASQTNLLALNATIEAAPAGDAGRGFAVVASEVESLAGQTAKATSDIGAQIGEMQQAIRQCALANARIAETVHAIDEAAAGMAAAVEEQSTTTRLIAHEAREATALGDAVAAANASALVAVAATSAAAERVLAGVATLARETDGVSLRVRGFVSDIRAA